MSSLNPWRVLILDKLTPLQSQIVWHACALSLSEEESPPNLLILQIPTGKIMSCGFHNRVRVELNIDACNSQNIPFTKRLCGGGTVLLDENQIFFNVLLPGFQFPSPMKNLLKIALPAPNKLYHKYGIPTTIDLNEIEVRGRKISGTGMASIEKVGLIVGNILLDFDSQQFLSCINYPSENYRVLLEKALSESVTSIKRETEKQPSKTELISGLLDEFKKSIEAEFHEDELTESEWQRIKDMEPLYQSHKWLYKVIDEGEKPNFIKVKKDLFVYHSQEFNADFLVKDGRVVEVLSSAPISDITNVKNKSIVNISLGKFYHLREELRTCRVFSNR